MDRLKEQIRPVPMCGRFVLMLCLMWAGLSLHAQNVCDPYLLPVCPQIKKAIAYNPNLGVSIAVSTKPGKLAFATFNSTPEGEAIRPDMLFEVGSITKTFTAARIMQLIESRHFGLDTSLAELFNPDELPFGDKIPTNLTIRHLLNLNAGLNDYVEQQQVIYNNLHEFWPMRNMTSAGYFPNNPYVGQLCYTSTNSLILGLLIDKINGGNGLTRAPLVESYHRNLFTPAGLKNTYIGGYEDVFPISSCTNLNYLAEPALNWYVPPGKCPDSDLAMFTGTGTAWNDSQRAFLSFAGPAGGIVSTSGDIATWFRWLFDQGPGREMVSSPLLIGQREAGSKKPISWYKCGYQDQGWPYINPRLVRMEMGYNMEINSLQYDEGPVTTYSFLGGTLSFNAYGYYIDGLDVSVAILVNNMNMPNDKGTPSSKYNSTGAVYAIAGILTDYIVKTQRK